MMLDMKRTFDEVVESQATPGEGQADPREPLLHRAVELVRRARRSTWRWRSSASSSATPQRTGTYDLIVVDTPPSRSALDFLDAPERLSSFLDGRFVRLLLAPARGPARIMTAGLGMVTGALSKILGGQFLTDLQTFVAALDTVFGGFRARAQQTYALLQADGTAFLVVAAPEPDALREAAYFVERLGEERMPLAGLVVNRASPAPAGTLSADEAMAAAGAAAADAGPHGSLTAGPAAPARRPGPDGRARGGAARAGSRPPTRRCRRRWCRRWPATCTTSTGSATGRRYCWPAG